MPPPCRFPRKSIQKGKAEDVPRARRDRPVLLAVLASDTGSVWKADFLGSKRLADAVHCWAEAHAPGEPLPDGLRVTGGRGGPELPLSATLKALKKKLPITEGRYRIIICLPGGAPPAASLCDGEWRLPRGRSAVIRGSRLRWSDGSHTKLHWEGGRTISLCYKGDTRTATQRGERLEWSDGEVWRRERGSQCKGGFGVSASAASARRGPSGRSQAEMAAIFWHYAEAAARRGRLQRRSPSRGLSRSRANMRAR